MITPKGLAPDYPLNFLNSKPLRYDEIPDSEKIVQPSQDWRNVSYSSLSYSYKY